MNSANPFRFPRPRIALSAAAAVAAVVAGSGTHAAAGAETIVLPIPFAAGQSADTTMTMNMTAAAAGMDLGLGLEMVMSSTVEEVLADGSARIVSEVTDVTVLDAPAGAGLEALEGLEGVVFAETRSVSDTDFGAVEVLNADELDPGQDALVDEMLGQFSGTMSFDYPDGPVAVGDTWTADALLNSSGVEIPASYEYELVAFDAETYTIEISIDTEIDTELQGVSVEGFMVGTGTFVGSRTNPLVLDSTMTMDSEFGGGGFTMEMQMSADVVSVDPLA